MKRIDVVALYLSAALSFLLTSSAWAQSSAPPIDHSKERPTDAAPEEPEEDDGRLEWNIVGGALLNTGNTQSFQVNAGTNLDFYRDFNQLYADFNVVYGIAVLDPRGTDDDPTNDDFDRTAFNINSKLRYDRFFTEMDAAFLGVVARHDRFAGLDLRIQGQIGYLRNFFKEENHRFWGEAGYDITYDNFDPDPLTDPDGNELDGDAIVQAIRLFLGYDNQINKMVAFGTGLEALFNVEDGEDVRLNSVSQLNSTIADNLQLELKFTLLFDNVPVAGFRRLDTTTQLNLIYRLL